MRHPIIIAIVALAASGGCSNEPETPREAVRQSLEALIEICRSDDGDYRDADRYIVYRDRDDKSRRWKDTYDASNPEELAAVNGVCYEVNSHANEAENWTYGAFSTETESEGTWLIQEVEFHREDGSDTALFAFLQLDSGPALGDID